MDTVGKKPEGPKPPDKKTRSKSKAVLAIFYVGYLAAILAGVEVIVRLVVARPKDPNLRRVLVDYHHLARGETNNFRFVADSELPYRLKADFEFRSPEGGKVTHHNTVGFRDVEDFPPKTEAALRIICLGGSTTYGVSVIDNRATYPAALERFLNGEHQPQGWDRVEVFNLGVGGYTSREVLTTFQRHGLPLQPDVVLIQSGLNDVAPRLYPDFDCDYRHFRKSLTLPAQSFLARQAYHSRLFLTLGWKLNLIEPFTLQARTQYPMPSADEAAANFDANGTDCLYENLTTAVELAKNAGARVWMLSQVYLNDPDFESPDPDQRNLERLYRRGLLEHNKVIRDVCMSIDTGLVDFENVMPRRRRFFTDPVHMSEEGNEMKAKLIAKSISSALSRMPNPSRGSHSEP